MPAFSLQEIIQFTTALHQTGWLSYNTAFDMSRLLQVLFVIMCMALEN